MTINNSLLYLIIGFVVLLFIVLVFVRRSKRSRRHEAKDAGQQQVYIGNLPYKVSEAELRQFFGQFGKIHDLRVVRDSHTGQSRGYGFVTYESPEHVTRALSAHGQYLEGRTIVVRIAKPKSYV